MTLVKQLQEPLVAARAIPAEYNTSLRAVLVAPQAVLHREAADGEAAVIGAYNPASNNSYDIPDRDAAQQLDEDSVSLLVRSAELEVYHRSIGVDGTVAPAAGYKNRLTSSNINYKNNGTAYPISAQLAGREVQVGDKVVYNATVSSVNVIHSTTVMDILANIAAASIGSASANAGNKSTQGASASFSQTAGALNWVTGTADASSYNDLDGGVNRTYTAVVVVGGSDSVARLQIISSDGLDDVANVATAAFSAATAIGTKGLTITFTLDNGRPVDSGAPTNLFVVGQKFQVVAAEAFTAPTATAGGTYTSTVNVTNIITVTRGGHYADDLPPQITVTTDTGTDSSGPTDIVAPGTNYAVGTHGVVVQFNQTGLNKGDIYYIVATAPAETNMRTIVLKDDLPTDLQGVSDGELSIRVVDTLLTVRSQRLDSPPDYNWELADPQITVNAGITGTLTDGTLVDEDGEAWYVPLVAGTLVVQYREWSRAAASRLQTFATADEALSELVSLELDNPAGYLIGNMLKCSNGLAVGLVGVADPSDVESWTDAIDSLEAAENCYHICLGTDDLQVIDALKAHLENQNDSTVENFRIGVVSMALPSDIIVVDADTTSDESVCLATIADNPSTSGTQYNYVTSTNGNFITNGVRAGDKFRTAYSTDGYGNESYTEFSISSIINENTLVLTTSSTTPYSVPQRAEVHRVATASDKVAYAQEAVSSRRSAYLRICVPDALVDSESNSVGGYAAACSLAACLSAVAPHQPFNYFEIPGYSSVYGSGYYFLPSQLKALEASGLTVIDDDGAGTVFVRKCVTTLVDTPENTEDVLVRNDHALKFILRNKLSYYRGQSMNVPSVVSKMSLDAKTALQDIASVTKLPRLGPMIDPTATAAARRHASLPGLAVLEITGSRPYPMNEFTTSLLVPVG